jgi:hypothetical protein
MEEQNFGIEVNYGSNIGYLGSPRYGIFNPNASLSPYQALIASASAYWTPDKADGVSAGINAPFTNPLKDLKGTANCTLQGFAGTSADGYITEPVLHETKGDSVNFVNLLGNDGNMIDSNADNRADGWVYGSTTPISCVGNEVVFLPTVQFAPLQKTAEIRSQNVGDILYFCAFVKSVSLSTFLQMNNGSSNTFMSHSGGGQYEFLSTSATLENKTSSEIRIQSNLTSAWTNITAKQAHLFNLSQIFPNPNRRPTKAQMDKLVQSAIAKYGYINERILRIEWLTFLNLDGVNSFGQFANMDVLNPVGTDDFAQLVVFRPDIMGDSRHFGITRNGADGGVSRQYALITHGDGNTYAVINGSPTVVMPNNLNLNYVMYGRFNNNRSIVLNGVEVNQGLYNVPIVSQPNTQMACRSGSVDGLTKTSFGKGLQGDIAFWKGAQGTLNKAKLVDLAKKAMKSKYNLGV